MIDRITSTETAANRLCSWYEANHRRLPWRDTRDPYKIWLSETMLQQTRVETVIPYYHAFLESFPTLLDLAAASEDDVLKHWQGLGYYSRVKNLHRAAKVVAAEYAGIVPDDPAAFSQLPGVGPYTCGAVQSIAFDRPVPAVDGNVLRVMTRYLLIRDSIDRPAVKRTIADEVRLWLESTPPAVLTQALMELGATVCVPRSPKCGHCPLQADCLGHREGVAHELPVRPAKRERRRVKVYALWLQRGDLVCIEQRPAKGLLGSMWQLPAVEADVVGAATARTAGASRSDAAAGLADNGAEELWPAAVAESNTGSNSAGLDNAGLGNVSSGGASWGNASAGSGSWASPEAVWRERLLSGKLATLIEGVQAVDEVPGVASFAKVAVASHVFTHLEWEVEVYRPVGDWSVEALAGTVASNARWVALGDLSSYAWPRVYDKLVTELSAGFQDG
ncbi:A/G-specific adenine glycosylase [Alicyclobacillus sp. ALC3]|uniref:A/G-specific adenine glycosylase n=1 Tax=Alicyclobacillus sp. ALC3 TaxID=2796143 RepID=UPI002378DA97|nr:A/G-specific adenine glycosylase [Alicyclobacillus sp. ALC3]